MDLANGMSFFFCVGSNAVTCVRYRDFVEKEKRDVTKCQAKIKNSYLRDIKKKIRVFGASRKTTTTHK